MSSTFLRTFRDEHQMGIRDQRMLLLYPTSIKQLILLQRFKNGQASGMRNFESSSACIREIMFRSRIEAASRALSQRLEVVVLASTEIA